MTRNPSLEEMTELARVGQLVVKEVTAYTPDGDAITVPRDRIVAWDVLNAILMWTDEQGALRRQVGGTYRDVLEVPRILTT